MLVIVVLLLVFKVNEGCLQLHPLPWGEDVYIVPSLIRRLAYSVTESKLELPNDARFRNDLVEPLEVNHLSLFYVLGSHILVLVYLHQRINLSPNV
jgi:hypothetical protein